MPRIITEIVIIKTNTINIHLQSLYVNINELAISSLTSIIPAIINHRIFIFNFVMEIAISYTNLLSYTKGNNPRSTIIGKIKTALLSLTLILAYIPNMNNLVIFIFSLITIICQVITLIKYINTDMEMDKKKKSSS